MRMQFLDTARAFAVLFVIFYHTFGIWNFEYPRELHRLVQFGGSGVILFFVVSGFSLCHTMQKHLENPNPTASYSLARIFRIAPLYYVLLAITIFRDAQYRDMVHDDGKIAASALMVFNFWPEYSKGIVWASWTIGVEVIFYCIFPFLYLRLDSITKKLTALLASTWATYLFAWLVLPHVDTAYQGSYSYMNFPRNLSIFLVGMLAYDAFRWLQARHAGNRALGTLLVVAAVSLLAALASLYHYTWGKRMLVDFGLIQAFAYALLVCALSLTPYTFVSRWTTNFFSRICYSAYLWHPITIWAMKPYFDAIYALDTNLWAKSAMAVGSAVVAVGIIGQVSYVLVEKPGQNIGKAWLAAINRRKVAA